MDYPQRFFNRMFGFCRPLELARRFAVYCGILALLISACGFAIFWARRSLSVRPYFLHMAESGDWAVYSEKNGGAVRSETPWFYNLQESKAVRFSEMYFRITDDMAANEGALWCECGPGGCASDSNKCAICCASSGRAWGDFASAVAPKWRAKAAAGEMLELVDAAARPIGEPDASGGFWEVRGALVSNVSKIRGITAFVRMARDKNAHGDSLGFYVSEFLFYKE